MLFDISKLINYINGTIENILISENDFIDTNEVINYLEEIIYYIKNYGIDIDLDLKNKLK